MKRMGDIKMDFQGYLLCDCGDLYQYCRCGKVFREDVRCGEESDKVIFALKHLGKLKRIHW